jgi:hypothetical protein
MQGEEQAAAIVRAVFDAYQLEHGSEYSDIVSSFAHAREHFVHRFEQLMRVKVSPASAVVGGAACNAVDRGHFERRDAALRNPYVGCVRLPLDDPEVRVKAQGVCRTYGLFMATPGDGATFVWLPMFWDERGVRHCPSMATDGKVVGGLIGVTKDIWGDEVPRYTVETYQKLKAHAMADVMALMPPAPVVAPRRTDRCTCWS